MPVSKLPTGVWIQGATRRFFQPVVYEGIEQLCFKCGIIGHVAEDCGGRHNGNGLGKEGGGGVNGGEKKGEGCVGLGVEPANPPRCMEGCVVDSGKGSSLADHQGVPSVNGMGGKVKEGLVGKTLVEECREDYGYGEWTVVQRRKPKGPLNFNNGRAGSQVGGVVKRSDMGSNNVGKPHDDIIRFSAVGRAVNGSGRGNEKSSGEKPFLFYTRGGKGNGHGKDQWLRKEGGSKVEAVGGCNKGIMERGNGGKRPIRQVEKDNKGGTVPGSRGESGSMGDEKVGVDCSSPTEEVARKRRRGATEPSSGGYASPLVEQ